jgi:hypothetical protein
VKKILARIRKEYILLRANSSRGGSISRDLERIDRLTSIRNKKSIIRRDFVNSWRLGEIKEPTEEERKKIFSDTFITHEFLMELQKKYWRENI